MAAKKKTQNIFATAAAHAREFEAHKVAQEKLVEQRKSDNRFTLLVSAGAVVAALVLQLAYFGFGPGYVSPSPAASESANSELVPDAALAEAREWSGTIEIGGKTLGLSLDGKNAPQAVANFISLAGKNFFDNVSCHRLTTKGIFVLQCGDPTGDGTGGPGYSWGPIENAPDDDIYKKGYLAMARQPNIGTSMGSQFFIVYKDSEIPADVAGGYTVFGKITKGLSKLNDVFAAGVADGTDDGAPSIETKLGAITLK